MTNHSLWAGTTGPTRPKIRAKTERKREKDEKWIRGKLREPSFWKYGKSRKINYRVSKNGPEEGIPLIIVWIARPLNWRPLKKVLSDVVSASTRFPIRTDSHCPPQNGKSFERFSREVFFDEQSWNRFRHFLISGAKSILAKKGRRGFSEFFSNYHNVRTVEYFIQF